MDVAGAWQPVLESHLSAPVFPASAFDVVVEDELVARRATELTAAVLSDKARKAAGQGDWDAVDRIIAEAAPLMAANPWLAATFEALKKFAELRNERSFATEAAYSSNRQRSRLASRSENPLHSGEEVASYLRRKNVQGRAQ